MTTANWQPKTLKNEQIELVPLQISDFERLFKVASNKLVWEQHPNPNRYKIEDFTTYFEGAIQSGTAFLVQNPDTKEVMGCTRFYDLDEENNSIKIGYTFLGIAFWGKGNNASMKKLLLDYAFQFVDKVLFEVGAENFRSQKAMEKIGGKKIGEKEVSYYGEMSKLNYIYQIEKE